jgi:hypothetical protein
MRMLQQNLLLLQDQTTTPLFEIQLRRLRGVRRLSGCRDDWLSNTQYHHYSERQNWWLSCVKYSRTGKDMKEAGP